MKSKIKILLIIVFIIIILGVIFFAVDFNRAKNNQKPIFCIENLGGTLLDGGTTEYFGLGYKVIDFHAILPIDENSEEIQYFDDVKIGTWFMDYDDFRDEMKVEK